MRYDNIYKVFAVALTALALIRTIMKLFLIDAASGFVNLHPWVASVYMFILAVAVGVILFGCLRAKSDSTLSLQPGVITGVFSLITGVLLGANGGFRALYPSALPTLIVTPSWLNIGELAFCAAAALALIYIGIKFIWGKGIGLNTAIASLVVAVWQSLWAIIRFGQFMQVSTVSDNLLEAMFMVFAPLFWVSQAYSLSGIPKKNISGRTIGLGLSTAILCLPLVVGQLVAIVFFKGETAGPSLINSVSMLSMGIYTVLFSLSISNCDCPNNQG